MHCLVHRLICFTFRVNLDRQNDAARLEGEILPREILCRATVMNLTV
jgi:hypothetical protein